MYSIHVMLETTHVGWSVMWTMLFLSSSCVF